MRINRILLGMGLVLALSSCEKEPAVQYRLSREQLAWQGYRAGEVLRFGHSRDNRVRTYQITNVQDRMETRHVHVFGPTLPFPGGNPPLYQQIIVFGQRTDTVDLPSRVLEIGLDPNLGSSAPGLLAEAEWETLDNARLPLDEVNAGFPLDTLWSSARLLPSVTLGPVAYSQVIRVDNRRSSGATSLGRATRRLYYARGRGVVAFEEAGNDLWYRLP
jgi:hypothetical protein